MKLAQINAVDGIGSTGIIVKDLQEICLQNGIECEVIYSVSSLQRLNTYHIGNVFSNKLHALFSRISGKQGYFSYMPTFRLLRHFEVTKPDIIHLHNLHSSYINVPMLLKYIAKKNIATVVTLHDCWLYTGGCTHYKAIECDKWKINCGNCPKRYVDFPAYFWDSSRIQLIDRSKLFGSIRNLTVVGVSKWIVEEATQTIFNKANSVVIRNGIDLNFFHPVESDYRRRHDLVGKFLILAPANKWFLDSNQETLNFFSNSMTDDMVMIFVGMGADRSRLRPNMINLGFVSSREEIREIYSTVDVMINCSREESLSLLNVEVQSCGTPVVTYSNTGVRETVDNKCGFAVKNGSPNDLWEKLMEIKENGKLHYEKECQQWVKQKFDKVQNYKKYIDLYKTLV